MVTIIRKGSTKTEIKKLINTVLSRNPDNNLMKYAGSLNTEIDPSDYQKKVRDEWE